jgi:hypothetical protein
MWRLFPPSFTTFSLPLLISHYLHLLRLYIASVQVIICSITIVINPSDRFVLIVLLLVLVLVLVLLLLAVVLVLVLLSE